MRVNTCCVLVIIIYFFTASRYAVALTPTLLEEMSAPREFIFVENYINNDFFVTPTTSLTEPKISGANRWNSLKYNLTQVTYTQQSLGFINLPIPEGLDLNAYIDMWVDDLPVATPFLGLRCLNWHHGCDLDTALITADAVDTSGFYGAMTPGPVANPVYMEGVLSDAFYYYLNSLPIGDTFWFYLNGCTTKEQYDARAGQRCQSMSSGTWYKKRVGFKKIGHITISNAIDQTEVFIDSDGNPTLGEGASGCHSQIIGNLVGLACQMSKYTLRASNGSSAPDFHIYPSLNNSVLADALNKIKGSEEFLQFSLNGQNWKPVSGQQSFFTYDDLKSSDSIYLFFSTAFFKAMVDTGLSDMNTRDLINFQVFNTFETETGWYEFGTSKQLIIKPQDYSISIISTDYVANPTRRGKVGQGEPALDFDYIVTTSGSNRANEVLISVTGPGQTIQGRPWCIFSSSDGTTQVPFPGTLSFTTASGSVQRYDVGCDGQPRDMTQALWSSPRLGDPSNRGMVINKTTVRFSIGMDAPESMRTLNNDSWFGDVSASGEIHVQAIWRSVR